MILLRADQAQASPWRGFMIDGLSLSLAAGEVTSVVGPNGAGKSSILRLLGGDLKLTRGDVQLRGKSVFAWESMEKARHLAYLAQRQTLSFPFSVEEVVRLARLPHASGARMDRKIILECLKAFDVAQFRDRAYTDLSGGEQQRVQLARVFAQVWPQAGIGAVSAGVLLLDEPVAALDLAHMEMLQTRIKEFSGRGGSVGLVLHDLNFATQVSDRLAFVREGRLVAEGDPTAVMEVPVLEHVFGVSPIIGSHPQSGKPLVILR